MKKRSRGEMGEGETERKGAEENWSRGEGFRKFQITNNKLQTNPNYQNINVLNMNCFVSLINLYLYFEFCPPARGFNNLMT